jgi:hypothetical protein
MEVYSSRETFEQGCTAIIPVHGDSICSPAMLALGRTRTTSNRRRPRVFLPVSVKPLLPLLTKRFNIVRLCQTHSALWSRIGSKSSSAEGQRMFEHKWLRGWPCLKRVTFGTYLAPLESERSGALPALNRTPDGDAAAKGYCSLYASCSLPLNGNSVPHSRQCQRILP